MGGWTRTEKMEKYSISFSTHDMSHIKEYGPKTKSYTFVPCLVCYTQSVQQEDIIASDFN